MVVILLLAGVTFAFAGRPAAAMIHAGDFARRRNAWLALTLVAFLAHNYWVYAFIGGLLVLSAAARESNRVALYLSLLFVVPPAVAQIPGLGLINHFFALDHLRLMCLVLLLPALPAVWRNRDLARFGKIGPDKLLALWLLLSVALGVRESTITDTLRGAFYLFLDVFLPYFVISRSLRTAEDFRGAALGFVLAAMLLAMVGVFEAVRHWLLYKALVGALGLEWGYSGYLGRSGVLRAQASTGQPIALGYVMAVAMGFYLYLQRHVTSAGIRRLGWSVLAAGLVAPISRGPWVGAVALIGTFVATGPNAARRLAFTGMLGIMSLALLAILPGGAKVIDLLPFVGTVDRFNVDYRDRLIDQALTVIARNPWFGSVDFALAPELQAMTQGQGIIDVVNTYLLMALQIGCVGVALFVGFFALVCRGILYGLRRLPDTEGEDHLLGRALLATLLAILVMIFTVSPITIIPIVYWVVAGMGVAYAQMVRSPAKRPVAGVSIAPAFRPVRDWSGGTAFDRSGPGRSGRLIVFRERNSP